MHVPSPGKVYQYSLGLESGMFSTLCTQPCLSNIAASSGLRIKGRVSQKELASWERLGEGRFSSVYKAKLKGSDVAVKVLKNLKETESLLAEGNLLRYFYS